MQFDILTLFPESFSSYLHSSILKRAQARGHLVVRFHNFRDAATDRHKTVDDKPYGGGAGMVLKIEPIFKTLKKIRRKKNSRVILLSPQGTPFTQMEARRLTTYDQIVLLCGHYEGFDERVTKLVDEQISIGSYVLTSGELPAMVLVDAVTRLLPGVLGDDQSSVDETFTADEKNFIEYPHYTRPEIFHPTKEKTWRVPKILLSGNHAAISTWRTEERRKRTARYLRKHKKRPEP
ncbi:MAG: tRNA (guanosine(37)-N1)-methyltransferase TrmD [Patescibacteria group bacterium]